MEYGLVLLLLPLKTERLGRDSNVAKQEHSTPTPSAACPLFAVPNLATRNLVRRQTTNVLSRYSIKHY
jgi:hypothetical protein